MRGNNHTRKDTGKWVQGEAESCRLSVNVQTAWHGDGGELFSAWFTILRSP